MFKRDFEWVMDWLAGLPYDSYEDQHFYFQKDLALSSLYSIQGDESPLKRHAEAARLVLEQKIQERPEDPRYQAALGLVYAYLGRSEEAIQKGNLAASLHPVSRDAAQGPIYLLNLAKIYTVLGESEQAITQLEYLLSIPHAEYLWHLVSLPQLRLDPQWDSLREEPGFQRLLNP
jgi:tetratricopeptide (TPR) repeat protein